MSLSFKKTYTFAVVSTTYITIFSTALVAILSSLFSALSWQFCLAFSVSVALFSFFVLQYRVEHFIYKRVKKIYDDVSLLDSTTFSSQSITTDMATLTKEVKKFATDKKIEIENLKVRETLTRIGVASRKEKKIYQSCHILHKQGKYYIVHFKELFALDGKHANLTVNDVQRRNRIVQLLADWGLVQIVDATKVQDIAPLNQIKVLAHKEKDEWILEAKYNIGSKKKKVEETE